MLVDNVSFLKQLASLFETANQKGSSIWLTHKRLTYKDENTMDVDESELSATEYPCLVRATDGKEMELSTHIMPGNLEKLHAEYGALLKSSMQSLRKRDKKKEKERAERIALRKKLMTTPVVIEGPKRGAGRRKRQRRVRMALRQEESRKKFQEREQARV